MTGKPKRFVMLLFHRDRKHDHRISRAGLARIMYQNITTIYGYVFTVHEPTSTRIHKLAQTNSHYDHSLVFYSEPYKAAEIYLLYQLTVQTTMDARVFLGRWQ